MLICITETCVEINLRAHRDITRDGMSSNPMANCVNATVMPKYQGSNATMARFVADFVMLRLERIVESVEISRP